MSVRIDWNKLILLPKDADKSFEEFCYHIVSHLYGQYGTLGYFYNTPGSEFYIELNKPINIDGIEYSSGDILGWQAKFWRGIRDDENSPLDAGHIQELEQGFNTTVRYKGNIKLWVICSPGFFVQSQWDKLHVKLKSIKKDCNFVSWHRVTFEDFYLQDHHKINGIFHFYFGESYAIKGKLDEISKDTLSYLSKKFDVDIHTPTDFEDALLAIVNRDKAKTWLIDSIAKLVQHVENDKKQPIVERNTFLYYQFSHDYWELYAKDFTERELLTTRLNSYLNDSDHILENITDIKLLIEDYLKQRETRVDAINKELNITFNKYGHDQILVNYINEMVERVNRLENYISKYDNKDNTSILNIVNWIIKKDFSVFAEAGYGKTHFACSLASNMLERGKPVLFLTGSKFRNCNGCESKLKDLLQLPEGITVPDMLDALDFVAEIHDCRLPIIIDGLNETVPHADRWKEELPPLRRKITERQNLILVTTCREKEDYIRLIYGESNYECIENNILLPGIQFKNLSSATKLYFKKYDIQPSNQAALSCFTNPLLLKVFCEVNKGRHDFELNEHTLATCMNDYSQKLINNIATNKEGIVNRIVRHQIEEGLNIVALTIWNKKDRQIDFYSEFYNVFKDYTYAFLNEGMCFITERVGDYDKVQFAYDLVAGFHIAKAIISITTDADNFCQYIENHYDMLFGEQRHTLAEDIAKSLVYLVPIHYQKQWYELMPKPEVIAVAMSHLDIIASTFEGKDSLVLLLESNQERQEMKERICNCLFDRIYNHHNIRHLSLFVPFFTGMKTLEIDTWWNSKFAGYGKLNNVWSILHDRFWSNRYDAKDKMALSLLLCGVVDREFRTKFYNELFELLEVHTAQGLDLCRSIIRTKDYYIFEAVVSIVAGIGLRTKDIVILKHCIAILEDFLKSSTASHLVLIDDLDTLYCFAKSEFNIEYDKNLLYKNKEEIWPIETDGELNWYTLYDYDFEKYNIRPLFSYGYNGEKPLFTSEEVYGRLSARIKTKGYDEDAYANIQNTEDKKLNYRRDSRVSYAHKLGRGVLMEFYGWLMLNNYIPNEFKHTFRSTIIDIDPSHPKFYPKRTFYNQSMLPKTMSEVADWIEKNHDEIATKNFITTIPGHKSEWVLMRGYCIQKIEERYVYLYLSGTSQLISEDISEDEIKDLSLDAVIDYSNAFACELWWRQLEYTEDYDYDSTPPRLTTKYDFSGWDSSRFQYPHFYMLNIEIAKNIGLQFDMHKMTYYLGEEEVSAYFVNDNDMFFYMRKDVVDMILKKYNAKLRHHIFENRIVIGNPPKDEVVLADDQKFRQLDKDIFYHL